jgi:hypothetical protein
VAKVNNRATFDVTPEMLPQIGTLLPPGFYVAGSDYASGGVVRLILEGAGVTEDGAHLQLVTLMTEDSVTRTVQVAPGPRPTYG